MLGNLKLIIAAAVLVAFAGAVGFGMLFHAKWKAAEAEKLRLEQQVQVQQATIMSHQQNVTAMQGSVATQQAIETQIAPILQQIEDSTPVTYLNEKQRKIVADICRMHNCGGVWKVGSCSDTERSILPSSDKASVHTK